MPCTQDVRGMPAYKPESLEAMRQSVRLGAFGGKDV
jgi:hypothetical protein